MTIIGENLFFKLKTALLIHFLFERKYNWQNWKDMRERESKIIIKSSKKWTLQMLTSLLEYQGKGWTFRLPLIQIESLLKKEI